MLHEVLEECAAQFDEAILFNRVATSGQIGPRYADGTVVEFIDAALFGTTNARQ